MYNSNASLVAAVLPSQFACRSEGIYHSILSSWDIPLHIILMGYTTPYYPHAFYTLLFSWQDNPPPLSQYSYKILLTIVISHLVVFCSCVFSPETRNVVLTRDVKIFGSIEQVFLFCIAGKITKNALFLLTLSSFGAI